MKLTRKHYEMIATAIRDARHDMTPMADAAADIIVDHIGAALADDNPKFDRDRFVAACEVQP